MNFHEAHNDKIYVNFLCKVIFPLNLAAEKKSHPHNFNFLSNYASTTCCHFLLTLSPSYSNALQAIPLKNGIKQKTFSSIIARIHFNNFENSQLSLFYYISISLPP
jgi:hypothetical protein